MNCPADPAQARQILILQYAGALGYNVHMTPVFEALHRAGKTVIVATRGSSLQLLRHSPFVDHLIETPDPARNLRSAVLSLRTQLRALGLKPDYTFTGTADQRTRVALLGLLGTRSWLAGFTQAPSLYRHPLAYDPGLSRLANNLRLAALAGCATTDVTPVTAFSGNDLARAYHLLAPFERRPILAVIPANSGGHPTAWHDERWAELLSRAHQELGLELLYLGTAQDAPRIAAVRAGTGGIEISLAGQTSVSELAAVLALADYAVAIMTGAMHVARAVGTPMLVLGPSWEEPLEWMTPLEPETILLRGPSRPDRPPGYQLDEISVDAAVAELARLVLGFPPGTGQPARISRSCMRILS